MITDDRAVREKEFHNQWAQSIRLDELLIREAFEAPTAAENQYILSQMGDLKGKRVLDFGCGAGESSVYFALRGAEVFSLDISEEFLKVGKSLAAKYGVEFKPATAHSGRLPFRDESFDIVYGNGVLHHVDLAASAAEIRRILKPGARAFFIEPLPYNPAINVYRFLARGVRTEDEKPLTLGQIRHLKTYFSSFHTQEFWFAALLIFFHFFFVRRWNPSKVRYWKKVIEEGESYRGLFLALKRCDDFLMRALPFLRPLCWNTVIVAQK